MSLATSAPLALDKDIQSSADDRELVPIRVTALLPPTIVRFDLYLDEGNMRRGAKLYSAAAAPPSENDLLALVRRGINKLYARSSDSKDLQMQFRELLASKASMPSDVHMEIIRETVKQDLALAWKSNSVGELVSHTAHISELILRVCSAEANLTPLVLSIQAHDGDTFAHVTNVCVYVVLLARSLGITDERQLSGLGQAALLHDLGKRAIHKDILRKPCALNPKEKAIIADHPRLGFEELCESADLDREQLLMILHHHERIDGTGYPVGLAGEEICWTARLCAVVDVFDALSGKRAYRRPMKAHEVLEFLDRGVGNHFEKEYVQCWSSIVQRKSN